MTAFDPEKITFFAKTDARGQNVAFGIKAKDRQRHMYVVGKTGMGKSTLLENMAAQDIQNGEGMAFIDPHGSAAETLLEYVPEHRVKDVIYFAPFDTNHPVSFNVMEDVGADKRHLVVSGLMSTFKKIWVDAWSARMEYILTNALLVLIEYPDTTLLSVNRLFIDKNYRKEVVDYCKDPAVKSFWVEEFANYTDRFAAEALPAIQNKIGQFTGNPLIRNIIGQPHSSFDIREIMDEKKILIMNLSKGLIGETNANLLGSMLTTRIYLAAMSRADLPVAQMKQMPNFYFYVDEFQSFANATFANILSEARKYHLNLIIAHQYIAQMEEEVRDAVFGNVGTTVAFRVGPFDAEVLETVFTPRFLAADLVNLGFAQIYLTLMIDGIGSQPFSAVTLPPVTLPSVSCKGMVLEASQKNYAGNREEVEKLVDELHTPKKPEPKPSADRRPSNGNAPQNRSGNSNNGSTQGGNRNTAPVRPTAAGVSAPARPAPTQPTQPVAPKPYVPPTQNPAAQSTTTRPPRNNTTNETRRPTQSQKTPNDLRAILAKISQGDSKSNSISSTVLKDATADQKAPIAPTASKNFSPAKPTPSTRPPLQPRSKPATPPTHTPPTSDLKSALADVLKKVSAATEPKESQPPVVEKTSPVQPQPATTVTTTITTTETKPDVQAVPVVASEFTAPRRHIDPVHTSRATTPPPTPTPVEVTQPPATVPDTSLNAAEIKRMLRQSDQERSPFT